MTMTTQPLIDTIAQTQVAPGSVMAWWLGGTGFVFKTTAGTQIYVDPYLSNCALGIFGLERGFPPPLPAEAVRPDLVIATHWHEDHLDPASIIAQYSQAQFLAPPSCISRMAGWGIARPRMTAFTVGQSHTFRDVQITAIAARHVAGLPGWETDDAIGLLFDFGSLRVYHSGDTEYDLRLRALAYTQQPIHAALLVINGAGGNMNAHEAALLAWQLKVQTVIPMHHRLWKDFTGGEQATLDPQLMVDTYRRLGGAGDVKLLEVGAGITLRTTA
jgi:L-ascorbate 6-phosphate lactonase